MGRKKVTGAEPLSFEQLLRAYEAGAVKAGQTLYVADDFDLWQGTLESITQDVSRNPAEGHNPLKLKHVVWADLRKKGLSEGIEDDNLLPHRKVSGINFYQLENTTLYNHNSFHLKYYLDYAAFEKYVRMRFDEMASTQ